MLFSDAAILVWTKKYMLLFWGHFADSHRKRVLLLLRGSRFCLQLGKK